MDTQAIKGQLLIGQRDAPARLPAVSEPQARHLVPAEMGYSTPHTRPC